MNQARRLKINIDFFYKYGIYFVFAVIILALSIVTKRFYAPENIINIILQSTTTGLATIGIAFVLINEGIDLSVGASMVLCGVISSLLFNKGYGLLAALVCSIACGAVIGGLNGFVIARFKFIPFITTLAMSSIGRGVSLIINKTQTIYMVKNPGEFLVNTRVLGIPLLVVFLILAAVVGQMVLSKTAFGRQLFASGDNQQSAAKIGINVTKITFIVYLVSGIFSGISGLASAIQIGAVTPEMGLGREFMAISSAVLGGVSLFGGKGSILPGALTGVLLVTTIENGLVLLGANPYAYTVVRGIVIFLAVMIDCVRNKNELR